MKSEMSIDDRQEVLGTPENRNSTPDVFVSKRRQQEPFSGFGFYDRSRDTRTQAQKINIEEQIDPFGFGADSDDEDGYFSQIPQRGGVPRGGGGAPTGDTDSMTGFSSINGAGSLNSDSAI